MRTLWDAVDAAVAPQQPAVPLLVALQQLIVPEH